MEGDHPQCDSLTDSLRVYLILNLMKPQVFSPLDLTDVLCHLADGVHGIVHGHLVGIVQ